ncbi:MAG: hypothetical protein ACREI7_11365 [Myxococcota bacterium]
MAKDRAAPFSKKHRRYWIPVVIGMVIIGLLNVGIGLYLYATGPKDAPRRTLPPPASPATPR